MECLAEQTVLGFIDGQLSPERATEVDEHVDSCPSCRHLLLFAVRGSGTGSLDQTMPVGSGERLALSPTVAVVGPVATLVAGRLARGTTVGRYVILDVLGQGGMGVVYAAVDPELDRKVAVKVLRPDASGGEAAERLLREGRAIARLAHPNVVAVFDVGTHDGSVFVAMELVDGQGLDGWLDTPRPWREVVGVFLQAGAGLIAAHAAGMVHRDFKPANVLMGKDGRSRVTDFGLVRLDGTARQSTPVLGRDAPDGRDSDGAAFQLTRTGAVMGTPAYMAPEQFEASAVDAKTDQFSFSVALYEALYAVRPFAGLTLTAIYRAIVDNRVSPAPAGTAVPAWLRQVVLRGLRARPDERHPTLEDMLSALRHDPSPKWRWILAGAGVLAIVALVATMVLSRPERANLDCDAHAGRGLAAWQRLRPKLAASKMLGELDRFAAELRAAASTECRGEEPDPVRRGLVNACLIAQHDRLEILAAESIGATAAIEAGVAEDMAVSPRRPGRCLDQPRTSYPHPLPTDPTRRQQAIDGHVLFYTAEVTLTEGNTDKAEALARQGLALAERSGDDPTLASAWSVMGGVFNQRNDHEGAIAAWHKSITFAERGEARGTLAFSHVLLANEICNLRSRFTDCEAEIDRASAEFERHPDEIPEQFVLTRSGFEAVRLRPEVGLGQLQAWAAGHPASLKNPYVAEQRSILEGLDGRAGQALRTIDEALPAARTQQSASVLADLLESRCGYLLDTSTVVAARAALEELKQLEIAHADDRSLIAPRIGCERAIRIELGDLEGARVLDAQRLADGGDPASATRISLLLALGRVSEVRKLVDSRPTDASGPSTALDWSSMEAKLTQTELLLAERRTDEARVVLDEVVARLRRMTMPLTSYTWHAVTVAQAKLALATGDLDAARTASDRMRGLVQARGSDAPAGQALFVEIVSAEVCARGGKWDCTDALRGRVASMQASGSGTVELHLGALLLAEATIRGTGATVDACRVVKQELAVLTPQAPPFATHMFDRKRLSQTPCVVPR